MKNKDLKGKKKEMTVLLKEDRNVGDCRANPSVLQVSWKVLKEKGILPIESDTKFLEKPQPRTSRPLVRHIPTPPWARTSIRRSLSQPSNQEAAKIFPTMMFTVVLFTILKN